jgi:hypothetical protein
MPLWNKALALALLAATVAVCWVAMGELPVTPRGPIPARPETP